MAFETNVIERAPNLFFSGALAAGQTLFNKMGATQAPIVKCHGMKRLIGCVVLSAAPAIVRLRFNATGSSATLPLVFNLTQDLTQAQFVFPFDVPVFMPYATIEVTDGGGGSTIEVVAWAFPEGSGYSITGTPIPPSPVIVPIATQIISSGDVGGVPIAAGNMINAGLDIPGLASNSGTIEGITLISAENLDWDVSFWTQSLYFNGGIPVSTFLASVQLSRGSAQTYLNQGGAAVWNYSAPGLKLDIKDVDATLSLHVGLTPLNANYLGGSLVAKFVYRSDS